MGLSSGLGLAPCATDLKQLEPECLDPGEHAVKRRLVGQRTCEKRLAFRVRACNSGKAPSNRSLS